MAKKGIAKRAEGVKEVNAPDGFDINIERARGDGWMTKQSGNEMCGRLLGRYSFVTKQGKKRAYYQFKLLRPCLAEVMPEDADENAEAITTKLEAGAVVNCDEIKQLEELEPYTVNGGVYDVWFVFDRQVDVGQPSPMWKLKGPKLRLVKKATEIPMGRGGSNSVPEDEIPL